MNKKIFGTYLLAILLLTGCADKGTLGQSAPVEDNSGFGSEKNETADPETELVPITKVKETFDEEAEKIRARKFDNVNFENAVFSFPEASEVCTLEYVKTQFPLSPDEAYDYMCKRIEDFFPGAYSDEEKAEAIRFIDCFSIDDDAKYPYCYPSLEQYKEMGLVTGYPHTMLSDEKNSISIYCGVLFDYVCGDLENYEALNSPELDYMRELFGDIYPGRIDAFSVCPSVYHTEDLKSEKTFHLKSGDVSIAEAAAFTKKYLSELELSTRDIPAELSLRSVYVLDIGGGCYAFYFTIVPEYKNVQYDSVIMDGSSFGTSPISNSTNEIRIAGHAMMYDKDVISRLHAGVLPYYYYEVVETGSQTSVIPLEKAAELASKRLARNMRFKAQSVSVVYKEMSDKEYGENPDTEARDARTADDRKINVNPCWKFLLKSTTEPKKYYHIYVDMLTGKVDTFVQMMWSEAEND